MKMFVDYIVLLISSSFHNWMWSQLRLNFRHIWQIFLLCLPGAHLHKHWECLGRRSQAGRALIKEPWLSGLGWISVNRGLSHLGLSPALLDTYLSSVESRGTPTKSLREVREVGEREREYLVSPGIKGLTKWDILCSDIVPCTDLIYKELY